MAFRPSLLLLLLLVIGGCSSRSTQDETQNRDYRSRRSSNSTLLGTSAMQTEKSQACRIVFLTDDDDRLEYVLSNTSAVKDLVIDPINKAKVDANPARYEILGYVEFDVDGKSPESILLFLPFGRAKRGDDYIIADLSELADHVSSRMVHFSEVIRY